jgi:hypothetical protein
LFLKNCTSDNHSRLGYQMNQQGYALCEVKRVVTKEAKPV